MAATKTGAAVRKKAAAKRRSRQADQARQDILNAAAKTFAERGYREARVQDIADRAGYTAGALYTYFKSKDELFDALAESVSKEITAAVQAPAPGADFATRLEHFVREAFSVLERHHHAVVYFMRLDSEGGPQARRARVRDVDFVTAIGEWLNVHAEDADFPGFSRRESATLIWATMTGVVRVWAVHGTTASPLELVPAVVRFILHGFQGKPATRRRPRGGT